MFVAQMTTEHFEFMAGGSTAASARTTIAEGWQKHIRNAPPAHPGEGSFSTVEGTMDKDLVKAAEALDDWYGIGVTEVHSGSAYIDGRELS